MKKPSDSAQYFYQTSTLRTVISDSQTRSFLRTGSKPLAEIGDQETRNANLLATDEMDSVLIVSTPEGGANTHCYTAFGHNDKYPPERAAIGFNGEVMANNMHLYLLGQGHRGYSTELGRFVSPDNAESPFGLGGPNPFAYCLNDPVNRTDGSGMWSLFKPRTWFRSDQQKLKQRLTSINNINNVLAEKTSALDTLVKENKHFDLATKRDIDATRIEVRKTLKASMQKSGRINKYMDPDKIYIFPEQEKARQAISNSIAPTLPGAARGNLKQRTMLDLPQIRDDAYDDANYKSPVAAKNTQVRQQ